jgi:hypothetical protein
MIILAGELAEYFCEKHSLRMRQMVGVEFSMEPFLRSGPQTTTISRSQMKVAAPTSDHGGPLLGPFRHPLRF